MHSNLARKLDRPSTFSEIAYVAAIGASSSLPPSSHLPVFQEEINFHQDQNDALKIRVNTTREQSPEWLETCLKKLSDLSSLPPNWDTYSAKRISKECLELAIEVLRFLADNAAPAPQVFPTARGGVQYEWSIKGFDAEVEIAAPNQITVAYEDAATRRSSEKTVLVGWESYEALLHEIVTILKERCAEMERAQS